MKSEDVCYPRSRLDQYRVHGGIRKKSQADRQMVYCGNCSAGVERMTFEEFKVRVSTAWICPQCGEPVYGKKTIRELDHRLRQGKAP